MARTLRGASKKGKNKTHPPEDRITGTTKTDKTDKKNKNQPIRIKFKKRMDRPDEKVKWKEEIHPIGISKPTGKLYNSFYCPFIMHIYGIGGETPSVYTRQRN